jgi:hypothetical protein
MARNKRTTARFKASKMIEAHREEYLACGIPAKRFSVQYIGFEALCRVDGKPMWKVSVRNEPSRVRGEPDRVWAEDEYIGPIVRLEASDPSLSKFLPSPPDAIVRHY